MRRERRGENSLHLRTINNKGTMIAFETNTAKLREPEAARREGRCFDIKNS